MTRRRFVKIGAITAGTVALGGVAVTAAAWAPEEELPNMRIGDGDMKMLVVYGTKSGCTTGIAEQVGKTLAEQGATVDVVPAEKAGDPAAYDAVFVGSGVRAGSWHEPVRTWVSGHADTLKSRPVAFYTCGMMIAQGAEKTDEVRAYTDALIAETGLRPADIGLFAGWFEPKEFSFAERTILKLMKTPQGDFRDLSAVAVWTRSTSGKMGALA
jgi:menaquinone-dependent protoporphyrinogen oxidase